MKPPDLSPWHRHLFASLVFCWLATCCQSGLQAQAPTITRQPQSMNIAAGMNATFSVQASSSLPLQWQWQLNESPVPKASSLTLTITNAMDWNLVFSHAAVAGTMDFDDLSATNAARFYKAIEGP